MGRATRPVCHGGSGRTAPAAWSLAAASWVADTSQPGADSAGIVGRHRSDLSQFVHRRKTQIGDKTLPCDYWSASLFARVPFPTASLAAWTYVDAR